MLPAKSDVVRVALRLMEEYLVEPGDAELLRAEAAASASQPDWGPQLAAELEKMHRAGAPVVTDSGVRNLIRRGTAIRSTSGRRAGGAHGSPPASGT